ncbi:hypothetical protein D3C76_964350 [compost metagenome]|uniref:Uncharacterized conserved protein, DUF924 family n=2 Tax=Pseudomonas jinjuensis TaxID=198616 RepID=A0A1H0PLF1_9PSED|nr:Uncharacterized conserved protein, DUF924 family [Pseudomonas jinjuensis]
MAPWQPLLEWWFGDESTATAVAAQRQRLWFGKNACQDLDVDNRFGGLLRQALEGGLEDWSASAQGWLALILLLDQLPRMAFRDTPRAYAGDARAQRLVRRGLAEGLDRQLQPIERAFVYLVLEHAEDKSSQALSVELHQQLCDEVEAEEKPLFDDFLDWAVRHQRVVERFGRFPHRNAILGRACSEAEERFLREPGSRF